MYAPVFDTSGYYVKESEEIEVGDVIEEVQDLKYDKRIRSAKKVQGVK